MELQTSFSRRVGVGTIPLLGSDTIPTGLPAVGSATDLLGTIVRSVHSKVLGDAVQRVWMFYVYAGAGPAPTVPVDAYAYVRDLDTWVHLGSQVMLTTGQANYVDVPALVKAAATGTQLTEESAGSLEVVLVPAAPPGAPAGTYTFGAAFDVGVSPGDEATLSLLTATKALTGTIRHTTTPTKADAATGPAEVSRTGDAFVSCVSAAARVLALPTTGAWTGTAVLAEGACDGIECETDAVYVFGQMREAHRLASITPGDWTLGAGWSAVGTVITHTNGGGTNDLELAVHATYPIQVGIPYCVEYVVSGCTGGTVTEKLGTAGATARNADGKYVQVIVPTVNGKVIFTPSDPFDGSIDIANVWVYPACYLPVGGTIKPCSFSRIAACTLKATPATMIASPTTAIVRAHWYRRAGAVT